MVASGTFGFVSEFAGLVQISRLGAIVTKTITRLRRAGNPPPRLFETASGMLNSVGLANPGIRCFVSEYLPRLREFKVPVIVSIGGDAPADYAALARQLDRQKGVAGLELNISCPNVASGGAAFGCSAELAAKVAAAVRGATRLPLIVKLTPNVADIASVAQAALDAGAHIIAAVNTLKGLAVDWRTRKSQLGGFSGGLSGPAIRPIALHAVWQIASRCKCPVVGIGGIMSAQDVLEFMVAGASAVQVGTASFIDPTASAKILGAIPRLLQSQGISAISSLIGTLRPRRM
jgi:dihydroorotate dehydrogenase (NAD+) catalytic subunit